MSVAGPMTLDYEPNKLLAWTITTAGFGLWFIAGASPPSSSSATRSTRPDRSRHSGHAHDLPAPGHSGLALTWERTLRPLRRHLLVGVVVAIAVGVIGGAVVLSGMAAAAISLTIVYVTAVVLGPSSPWSEVLHGHVGVDKLAVVAICRPPSSAAGRPPRSSSC